MKLKKLRYTKSSPIEKANDLFMAFHCDACFRRLRVSAPQYGYGLVCPHCQEGLICPKPSFHVGEDICYYRIDGWISSGAMGEVYYAHGLHSDKTVALKILNRQEASDKAQKEFEHEAYLVKNLNHPHIPHFSSTGKHQDKYSYFAMEYIDGESADHLLLRLKQLDEELVLKMIIQMAEVLHYIWTNFGLLHRDIKPGNIVIKDDDSAFLIDWGLACHYTVAVDGENTAGTPQYICPKIVEASAIIDYRTDMYSLGATAFHLLTGEFAFMADSVELMIDKTLAEKVRSVREVRPELSEPTAKIIQKMMAREYKDRYQNWGELVQDTQQALDKLS